MRCLRGAAVNTPPAGLPGGRGFPRAEEGYCGRCHWWTGDPVLYAAWKAERKATAEDPPRAAAS